MELTKPTEMDTLNATSNPLHEVECEIEPQELPEGYEPSEAELHAHDGWVEEWLKSTRGREWLKKTSGKEPQTATELVEWYKENPLRYFIKDIAEELGVHVLHGPEGAFKTMITLQMQEAMTIGGECLLRKVEGGLRTGIAELEIPSRRFGKRLMNFRFKGQLYVLPESQRQKVLAAKNPADRIAVIADWASKNSLDFVSIDSMAKLFPLGFDISRQDIASEVFNQAQRLPTTWILAHNRKQSRDAYDFGNEEIAGSGRLAQDPDAIFRMVRPDKRAPIVEFHWGKMREGEMHDPITLFFDKVDFRLYPIHPFLHLLPRSRQELLVEADARYGWKHSQVDSYLKDLKASQPFKRIG